MSLPVVPARLSHAPEATLLQLDSPKMIIQDAASVFPIDIPDSNEYLLEYHAQLVQHTKVLLQDHSVSPISLTCLSPDP